MRRQIVQGVPGNDLKHVYEDHGPSRARPKPSYAMNAAGGGGHLKGTKTPGSSNGKRER